MPSTSKFRLHCYDPLSCHKRKRTSGGSYNLRPFMQSDSPIENAPTTSGAPPLNEMSAGNERLSSEEYSQQTFLGKILDLAHDSWVSCPRLWSPNSCLLPKIPAFLVKIPTFVGKISAFLVKIPTFLGKIPAFLVKIPAFLGKIPAFLVKIPAFLGKILTPSIHMINLYSKQG
ncbi:hypothetical protein EMCRGX_G032872 [Ephydatia muelleri]